MQRPAISLAALAALVMVGLGLTLVELARAPGMARAQALATAADPPADLPLGALPASCAQAPVGSACESAVVADLDSAHSQLGLGPYNLPRNFTSLAPARQLLVLTNLDRVASGLTPVAGLNAELDQSALEGVEQLSDPLPPVELLPSTAVWGFTSNWAGSFPNAPAAYYAWMYDDGYGSDNAACTSPGADGCWGHRQNVLWPFPEGGWLAMGAAGGVDMYGTRSFAMMIVYTHGVQSPDYYYTWNQAVTAASASRRAPSRCATRYPRHAARTPGTKTGPSPSPEAHNTKATPEPRAHGSKTGPGPHPGACSDGPGAG